MPQEQQAAVGPQLVQPPRPPLEAPPPLPSQSQRLLAQLPPPPVGLGAFAATSRLTISAEVLCSPPGGGGNSGSSAGLGGALCVGAGTRSGGGGGGGVGGGDVVGAVAAAMPALSELHLTLAPSPGPSAAAGATGAAAAAAGAAEAAAVGALASALGSPVAKDAAAVATLAALPAALGALLAPGRGEAAAAAAALRPCPLRPPTASLARGLTHLTISLAPPAVTPPSRTSPSSPRPHTAGSPAPPRLLPLTARLAAALAATGAGRLQHLHLPALCLDLSAAPDAGAAAAARHLAALTRLTSLALGNVAPAYSLLHDLLLPPPPPPVLLLPVAAAGSEAGTGLARASGSTAGPAAATAATAAATAATAATATAPPVVRPLVHLDLGAASGPLPARPLAALLSLQDLVAPRAELTAAGVGPLPRLRTLRVGGCKPEALAPALRPLAALESLDLGEAPGPLALAALAAAFGGGGDGGGRDIEGGDGRGKGLRELRARSATVTLMPPTPRPAPLAAVWQNPQQQQQQQPQPGALAPVGAAGGGSGGVNAPALLPPLALQLMPPLALLPTEPQLRARLAGLQVLEVGYVELELLPGLLQLLPALTSLDLGGTRGAVPAAVLAPVSRLCCLRMPRAQLVARGAPAPSAAPQPASQTSRSGGPGAASVGGADRQADAQQQENVCPERQRVVAGCVGKQTMQQATQQMTHQHTSSNSSSRSGCCDQPALAHLPCLTSLTLASCCPERLQPMLGPLTALTSLCLAACYSRAPAQLQPAALARLPALAELRLLPHAALAVEGLGGLGSVSCLEVGQLVAPVSGAATPPPPAAAASDADVAVLLPTLPAASGAGTAVAAGQAADRQGQHVQQQGQGQGQQGHLQVVYPLPPRLERLRLTGGQLPELAVLGRLQPPPCLREIVVEPGAVAVAAAGSGGAGGAAGAGPAFQIDVCPLRHATAGAPCGSDTRYGSTFGAAAAASSGKGSGSSSRRPPGPHLTAEGEELLVGAARLLSYCAVPPAPYCPSLHVAYGSSGGSGAPAAAALNDDRTEQEQQQQQQQQQQQATDGQAVAGLGARGHGRWLGALGGVRWLRSLQLSGLRLGWRDVEALAGGLPELEALALLPPCAYPLPALPLLGRLRRLRSLRVDTSCWLTPPGVLLPGAATLPAGAGAGGPAAPGFRGRGAALCDPTNAGSPTAGATEAAAAVVATAASQAAALQAAIVAGQAVAALVALRTAGGFAASGHLELLLPLPPPPPSARLGPPEGQEQAQSQRAPAGEWELGPGVAASGTVPGGWGGLRQWVRHVAAEVEAELREAAGWQAAGAARGPAVVCM
ncbi:hypothetical protein HYH02_007014 [Chlamydomonas schloesseri]|uniref:Uncharacterized protein n=1 Tax=Chlamydomonas schloesseri TaxID=2026947 RepID=A0A835WIB9_9CHLO|nr:hypothetical protein HYH02_007014 [Chlamydomonas schloesseri]|eukprot:KAG2447985.1 hypothetical protein HYH02_007014 [Chlamydomonas schloesseri]